MMKKKYIIPIVETYPCELQQVLADSPQNVVTNVDGNSGIGYGGSGENARTDEDGNVIVRGNSYVWDQFDE